MSEMVRCADCGYLAQRRTEDRMLLDAEDNYRRTAGVPSLKHAPELLYEEIPICFVRAINFREAISDGYDRYDSTRALTVIKSPRECGFFTKWHQGFTPKEHYEMMLEEKRLLRQKELEESDRRWRCDEAEKDHVWREGQRQLSEKSLRQSEQSLRVTVLLALFAASISLLLHVLNFLGLG